MKKEKTGCIILCLYLMSVGIMGCSAITANSVESSPPNAESKADTEDVSEPDTSVIAANEPEAISPADRKWSPELQAFMEEINDEHQAVKKTEGDYSRYVKEGPKGYINIGLYIADTEEESKFRREEIYSMEQVQEDLDIMMRMLLTNYGAYYYFGGMDKFEQVKEEIIEECDKTQDITGEFLLSCILDKLSFIEDAHFMIEGKTVKNHEVPCFYRETAFEKTELGYQPLLAEHNKSSQPKVVESVEGWNNLDELFKRSISDDGSIVYYPVVYQLAKIEEIRGEQQEKSIITDDLTVYYSDGSSQVLSAMPYESYKRADGEPITCRNSMGVPILFVRNMYHSEPKSDTDGKKFISYAETLRKEQVMIVDLRSNTGGSSAASVKWWETYTEHEVTANFIRILLGNLQDWLKRSWNTDSDTYVSAQTMQKTMGFKFASKYYTAMYSQQDMFVENHELLIILTSKRTASAAEHFTDIAHNVENTLIIGENSAGCMFGSSIPSPLELPNTHLRLTFGDSFSIFPEDPAYFQEFRGLEPDIWVPAGEAEELAVKFIERYMHE